MNLPATWQPRLGPSDTVRPEATAAEATAAPACRDQRATAGRPAAAEGRQAAITTTDDRAADPGHAVVVLTRARAAQRAWALWCLMRGEAGIGRAPGLRFARAMGSGRDGGFGLSPSLRYQGLMAFFDQAEQALAFAEQAPAVRRRLDRCDEGLVAVLAATSVRGSWDGHRLRAVAPAATAGQPVAALTRATVRPLQAARFWRQTPDSERALAAAPGCSLAAGLGEAPVLRQATFSLWDDTDAMTAYARQGAHGSAARQALGEGWFSEWMFVRFVPLRLQGSWHGRRFG